MKLSRFLFLSIAVFLVGVAFSQEEKLADLTSNLPSDPNVTVGTLSNGIHYYIRVNRKPEQRAELRLVVNVGSVLEDDDQRGLAHFCEHMAFNGTKHFRKNELVNYMESVGMRLGPDLNAYTSFDETVYMLKIPTDTPSIVEKAFQILGDWAHNVTYDDDEIDKERGVVIEEWRLGRGAEARMRDKQFPVLFKDSRYAERLTIGDKKTLETCSHETLRRFYRDWYRPELMAVVAVGDFDTPEIERLIQENFSIIPSTTDGRKRVFYPVPDHSEPLFAVASDSEATMSRVSVYYKHDVKHTLTVGDYRRSIVQGLYSGMLNNRLSELTRQADPPFLYGYAGNGRFVRTKDVYFLGAGVKENGIERGLGALLTEAERAHRYGFTPTELERQKKETLRYLENAYNERDKTESADYTEECIQNYLDGDPIAGIAAELALTRQLLPAISLDDVKKLTAEQITDKNRVVLVNLPEKRDVQVPTIDQLTNVFNAVGKENVEPYIDKLADQSLLPVAPKAGTIVQQTQDKKTGTTEWRLSNGARVIVKPTDFKNDEVLFTAFSPGGSSAVPDSEFIPASTATGIIEESGVGSFDATALQKLLAGKIVSVNPYLGELTEGLSGQATPQDLGTMFQLIYLYCTEPRIDSGAYQAFRQRMQSFLENRTARPEAAFQDTVAVTMSQYHPRRMPWTKSSLDRMDLKSSFDIYRDRFADASGFTFIFVGNIDTAVLKPLVEQYLASLPSLNRHESWRDIGVVPPTGVIEKKVIKGIEPKSQVSIVFDGPFEWSAVNRHIIQSLATALRIKLRENLREEKGGTYGVSVAPSPAHYPRQQYLLTIAFGCAPERVNELVKATFDQIDSLKRFGIGESYLQKVKESQRREREVNLKRNEFWLRGIAQLLENNEPPSQLLENGKLIDQLSLNDIQNAAKQYLDMNNYVKVILVPKEQ